MRNENSAASCLLMPSRTEHEIVAPDLEMPGRMAKACAKPTIIASSVVTDRP